MFLKKIARNAGVAVALAVAAGSSFAAAPATIGDLAVGVSFTDVALAILAIAAALITLHVTTKGAKMVMGFIGK